MTHYWIYLAEDMAGSNRSYVGSTRVGTNQMLIPADTEIPDIAYLLVFVPWWHDLSFLGERTALIHATAVIG